LGEAITAYVLQVLLGLIALLAVWKDWKEYRTRSKHWGKPAQVVLAAGAVLVIVLSLANTYYSRASARIDRKNLTGQITQLREDGKTANDGFRQSFAGLYDKFTQLQSQVQNRDLLKQNAALLQEIADTKKELLATEAKLTQPKAQLSASFHTPDIKDMPITETTGTRNGTTVSVPIVVFNPTDVTALNASVSVMPCEGCSWASEPAGFSKVPGAPDSQRSVLYPHIFAKSAVQLAVFDFNVPLGATRFAVSVYGTCESCPPSAPKVLWVNLP
jgi:hypothetical protein